MLLGNVDILEMMRCEKIDISPFDPGLMNPNSYDLRLAEYFVLVQPSKKSLVEYYGPVHIPIGARVFIPNGGTLLAYTAERVKTAGGIVGRINAKSSTRRKMISVVTDAGLGDDGYDNHWTLELSGHSYLQHRRPSFIVGEPICQITFELLRTPANPAYTGQYNASEMPLGMLPKKDRHLLRPPLPWMVASLTMW